MKRREREREKLEGGGGGVFESSEMKTGILCDKFDSLLSVRTGVPACASLHARPSPSAGPGWTANSAFSTQPN